MVEKQALITTVIPTYKRPTLVKRAIESALNQSFQNIQVIVFDNNSQDETAMMIKELQKQDSRLLYYCHKKEIKAVENLQFALSYPKTPFVSILADDDYLLPNFYEKAIEEFEKHPTAQFFIGSTLDVNAKGKAFNISALKWENTSYYKPPHGVFPVIEHYINWTGTLFRKSLLETNLLDSEIKAVDYDFMIRLAAKYPFVFSKIPSACFVHHAIGYSSFSGLKLVWPSYLKMEENALKTVLPNMREKIKLSMKKALMRTLFGMGCRALQKKDFEEVKKIIQVVKENFDQDKKMIYLEKLNKLCMKAPFLASLFKIPYHLFRITRKISQRSQM